MRPGYGLARRAQTADGQAVGERTPPQIAAAGLEARHAPATLVTMTTCERQERWCGASDAAAFARWAADRATARSPHLAPIARVGRCPSGHLAAELLCPAVRPLAQALDQLGVPSTGVAVTLTVPVLELARDLRAGAVEVGPIGPEDVGVDDAGAVLVADRPPGGTACCADRAPEHGQQTDGVGAGPPPVHPDAGVPPARTGTVHDPDVARQLVLAARAVWDRVDALDPARRVVDPLLDAARSGDVGDVVAALEAVRATAPPRPVRWHRPVTGLEDDLLVVAPHRAATPSDGAVAFLRDVVEHGLPLGLRRVPLRHALVGLVVAVGTVAIALRLV